MAIYWQENDLWYAQEQGYSGRQTIGGFLTRAALFRACIQEFGEDCLMEPQQEIRYKHQIDWD